MLINTKYQNDWIKLQTVPLNDQDYWHSLVWRETSSSFPVSSLTLGKKTMISIFISVRVVFNLTFAKNSWCIAADSSLVSLMWSDNCLETWASIWSIISNSQVYSIWCYKYIFDWFFLFFFRMWSKSTLPCYEPSTWIWWVEEVTWGRSSWTSRRGEFCLQYHFLSGRERRGLRGASNLGHARPTTSRGYITISRNSISNL